MAVCAEFLCSYTYIVPPLCLKLYIDSPGMLCFIHNSISTLFIDIPVRCIYSVMYVYVLCNFHYLYSITIATLFLQVYNSQLGHGHGNGYKMDIKIVLLISASF